MYSNLIIFKKLYKRHALYYEYSISVSSRKYRITEAFRYPIFRDPKYNDYSNNFDIAIKCFIKCSRISIELFWNRISTAYHAGPHTLPFSTGRKERVLRAADSKEITFTMDGFSLISRVRCNRVTYIMIYTRSTLSKRSPISMASTK